MELFNAEKLNQIRDILLQKKKKRSQLLRA